MDLGLHPRPDGDGQPLKWFAITDEYTRECLALEVDRGITSDRVLDILTNLFLTRGVPKHIRSDNGPEFIAEAIRNLGKQAGLEMLYIQPASPWENGFAESFFSQNPTVKHRKWTTRNSGVAVQIRTCLRKQSPAGSKF